MLISNNPICFLAEGIMGSMVKIKSKRIRKNGLRENILSLPSVWLDELGLKAGDQLDIYQDTSGRLMICPPGVTPLDTTCGEARELKEAIGK